MGEAQKQKTLAIMKMLDQLVPEPVIPLKHKDPYTLLIAVVLSAQCTDERVNQVTPVLFQLARKPEQMARLTESRIRAIIRPCGLSLSKSRNIRCLSRLIVKEHGGRVPQTFKELEALPGVGHKTASVIMAQAFGQSAFPVDTHIHRLAYRWKLSSGKNVEQTERDLKRLFPQSVWNKLHLQLIYYGRRYCPARGHAMEACPICRRFARKRGFK